MYIILLRNVGISRSDARSFAALSFTASNCQFMLPNFGFFKKFSKHSDNPSAGDLKALTFANLAIFLVSNDRLKYLQ
jgi:hypothetical protein